MINKRGFTLAEVLITIGIIGVIAAVTLPALNSNLIKSQLEVQTRKFYSQFTKALDLYKVDNETDVLVGSGFSTKEFVKKYFNVAEQCTKLTDCYAEKYNSIDYKKNVEPRWFDEEHTYELADGTVFTIGSYYAAGSDSPIDGSTPITLTFDVNGKKGPNKIGYDLWSTSVYYDGSVDDYNPETKESWTPDELKKTVEDRLKVCIKGENYGGCFGHFMRNGFKFDY